MHIIRYVGMGAEPHTQRGIRKERAQRADGGQPLNSESRTVQSYGHSLVIGLTAYAAKTHDISAGQEPDVEVYADGIWIDLGGDDDA